MCRLRLLFLPLLLALFAVAAGAEPLALDRSWSGHTINAQMQAFADGSGLRPSAGVLGHADLFVEPARAGAGLGGTAHWMRLQLRRSATERGQAWWLVVEPLNLFDLRVYRRAGDGGWQELQSGERVPFAAGREREWRQFAFRLPDDGEAVTELYLRAQDPGGASFPVALWHEDDLRRHERIGELLLGAMYGALLALSAYNLFLALSLRDRAYGWYVATTLSLGLFLVHLHGHLAQWLWRDQAWLTSAGRVLIPSVWGFALAGFVMAFFQTRRHLPRLHKVLLGVQALYVVCFVARLAGLHGPSAQLLTIFPMFCVPLVFAVAILRLRQGLEPARYFLIGYGTVLLGTLLFLLRIAGALEPSTLTELALPVAATLETLIFSLALAARIKQLDRSSQAAFVDELTGLPNRRALEQRFAELAARDQPFTLLALDLDRFKPVNDSFGHHEGDEVLRVLARRMQACIRGDDLVARVGGDEFVLLLAPGSGEAAVSSVVNRLLTAARETVHLGERRHQLSASVGLARFPSQGRSLAELSRHADMALYEAKQSGRDCWRAAVRAV
ncbi:diguanylate cyclase [Pelomonas sp. SE-A7]|uniref:diguanylate cyclase n=1 Tax=Pelomonas sp. SE-A7 TaxID=3054953 RepID=UPI00259C74F5|nr:diguanylate cyclase [Pelomonas sp. SE-A7]MDM4767261.1 diguanylate cyclase [Pelomonas sp. SE-A7]